MVGETSVAYIFPGQGSQYPGMGKDLATNYPAARKIFEEADDALGFSISRLCFEGTVEELQLTENTQPAILTVSVAALKALEDLSCPRPRYVVGHSLGEYAAHVAAGTLSLSDAVRTVRRRGQYMQEAVPVGKGAMAAVIGAPLIEIERVCVEAAEGEICSPANINSANQIVIAGDASAIDRAIEKLQGIAKKVVRLNVSAPFHCLLMLPAQQRLAVDLEQLTFSAPSIPVVANVSAAPVISAVESRRALIEQVSAPVRWQQSIEFLIKEGIQTFIEVGPGKVLCGLMRQINREVKCVNVEDSTSLAQVQTCMAAL